MLVENTTRVARLPHARYTEPDVIKAPSTITISFSGHRNAGIGSMDQVVDSEPVRPERIGNRNRRFFQHYVCKKHRSCVWNLLFHQLARKVLVVVGFYCRCGSNCHHVQCSQPSSKSYFASRAGTHFGWSFGQSLRPARVSICGGLPRILCWDLSLALLQHCRLRHFDRRCAAGPRNHPP